MRPNGSTFLLARLRAAGKVVVRQWTVFMFAACYASEHPTHPGGTVCATILFLWIKGLIETYRLTVTVRRRETPDPIPPFCPLCPRATGRRLSANSLN